MSFGCISACNKNKRVIGECFRSATVWGSNGCGKTTLIRIVMGLEKADAGSVRLDGTDLRVGYQPQGFNFGYDETVETFINRMEGDLPGLSERLDIAMLEWLEEWLKDFPGAVLLVSHDRAFLDGVANRILHPPGRLLKLFCHFDVLWIGSCI